MVVVGLGGVGSHCVALLARSGVSRIRVIDFDRVSLSSLNRNNLRRTERTIKILISNLFDLRAIARLL